MFKFTLRLSITFLISFLLISSNVFAFHKHNKKNEIKKSSYDGVTDKKEYETKYKQNFCTEKAEIIQDKKLVNDENTNEPELDENGNEIYEVIYQVNVNGYHDPKVQKVKNSKLLPAYQNILYGVNFIQYFGGKIKLVDLLKAYCLQDSTKDRPSKFKGSYLEEFYSDVAAESGFVNGKGFGDYNMNIFEGELGDQILKEGIKISNKNAVFYYPDFLIKDYKKHLDAKKKDDDDKKKEKIRKQKEQAKIQGNNSWLSEHKQTYIEQFEKKFAEYEDTIQILYSAIGMIEEKLIDYNKLFEETQEKVEETFEDVDTTKIEIKKLKKKIRKNVKKVLLESKLKDFEQRIDKLKKIKLEKKYENYKKLKGIIDKAKKKSASAKDFVGKKGYVIPWLGGKTKKITSDKIGFIEEFENLKNKSIGVIEKDKLNKLGNEIDESSNEINELIVQPIEDLNNLDIELESEIDFVKLGIYLIIFLVVSGAGVFVYLRISTADQKLADHKKSFEELQGQIKNTSEQIKEVRKTTSTRRAQETVILKEPEKVEKIKTEEEIITDKFDEMISDYKDCLEDFSKVAAFKQKWNGLALSRKERQDGTKTILINSTRAFEKAEIWCVNFSDKYFSFPGSTVKSNMATYMNMDFEKASRDFKGVFAISTGSSYSTEPAVIRRGGAGFVVERVGKLVFPN